MDGSTIIFALGAILVIGAVIGYLVWRRNRVTPSQNPEPARRDRLEANTITSDDLRAGTVSYGRTEARSVKTGRIETPPRERSRRDTDDGDEVTAWPGEVWPGNASQATPPLSESSDYRDPTPSHNHPVSPSWSDPGGRVDSSRDHGGGWNSGASSDSGTVHHSTGSSYSSDSGSSSGSSSSSSDSGGSSGGGGGGGGGE